MTPDGNRVQCRAVYRYVMYQQMKKKCNEKLQQKLYEIKYKRVVVAYERMKFV